tara:strand:- start:137 stop:322 length:186 start_codon:yes stop_codon:yes gene_type:complete
MAKTQLRKYIVDLIENDVHFHHKINDEKHTVSIFLDGIKIVSSYFDKVDEKEILIPKPIVL